MSDAARDELLRRATAAAPDEATRRWLSRLLEFGERAAGGEAGPDRGQGVEQVAATARRVANFATPEAGRRPR
jgi:hypothetical protein